MIEADDQELVRIDRETEDFKTRLFGHTIGTVPFGFANDNSVYSVSNEGAYFCQKIDQAVSDYNGHTRTVQSG